MKIYLITKNDFKKNEVKKIFKNYGMEVEYFENKENAINNAIIKNELNFTIMREETELRRKECGEFKNLESVIHCSVLKVEQHINNTIKSSEYKSEVKGFIDLTKRKIENENVYNWDDIFTVSETLNTYQELKDSNDKFSARKIVIYDFLKDLFLLKKKVDLNFNPLNQKNVISFSPCIYDLIDNNKFLNLHKNNNELKNLVSFIKSQGLFTKSAISKNQRNYWFPSLNAGLPLVPKKDETHETTFMFHDIMHHAMPDLILTGENNKEIKDTYVIHRMIGEAITLVLADMIYVDQLVESGLDYDWSKRKIYYIYKEFKNKNEINIKSIKKLLWANVKFALLGESRELINISNNVVVKDYTDKYEKFFIEDYRWTINNYENMIKNDKLIKSWLSNVKGIDNKKELVTAYSKHIDNNMNYEKKVEVIFNLVWKKLKKNMSKNIEFNIEKANYNAFKNYIFGQMFIFSKYENDINCFFIDKIKKEFEGKEKLTIKEIKRIRKFFNIYVERLYSQKFLTKLEKEEFKNIVPIFDSFFVFYDRESKIKEIKDLIKSF